jgi:hypothetical protein
MTSEATIEAVIVAIKSAYGDAVDRHPTPAQVSQAAGVSPATFYRVLKQSREAAAVLRQSKARLNRAIAPTPTERLADLEATVDALKVIIANLAVVIQQRDVTIHDLRQRTQSIRSIR